MTLKDLHLAVYIFILSIFFTVRINNDAISDHAWNVTLITYVVVGIWWFVCNWRFYTLTHERLDNLDPQLRLKWQAVIAYDNKLKAKIAKKVYITVGDDKYSYELDYWLTIPKNSTEVYYQQFRQSLSTVGDLYNFMGQRSVNKYFVQDYEYSVDVYNSIKNISLFGIIMLFLVNLWLNSGSFDLDVLTYIN